MLGLAEYPRWILALSLVNRSANSVTLTLATKGRAGVYTRRYR